MICPHLGYFVILMLISRLLAICDSFTHRQLQLRRCAGAKPRSPFILKSQAGEERISLAGAQKLASGRRDWPLAPQFANSARTPEPCINPCRPRADSTGWLGPGNWMPEHGDASKRCSLRSLVARDSKEGSSLSQEQDHEPAAQLRWNMHLLGIIACSIECIVTMARRYGVVPIERPQCSVPRQLGQLISYAARYCGLFSIVLRPAG